MTLSTFRYRSTTLLAMEPFTIPRSSPIELEGIPENTVSICLKDIYMRLLTREGGVVVPEIRVHLLKQERFD